MVDEINSQHTWRQVTSPTRVKKVKQRPDYNRDKRSNQRGRKGRNDKHKRSGKPPKNIMPDTSAPDEVTKNEEDDPTGSNGNESKNRTGSAQGKLIDIVV